jgi:hypothetical protein
MRDELKLRSMGRRGDLAYWIGGWSNQQAIGGRYIDGEKERWKQDLDMIRTT